MIIWKLEIEITGDDWENTEKYFFKTIEETKAFQEKYEKGHTKDDGSYIPTISSITYYFEENEFDNLKHEMTVTDYEILFNTILKPNQKLSLQDLEEDMFVWNDTQAEYQIIRYISTGKKTGYHWCDGWGNIIENDELYNYKLN